MLFLSEQEKKVWAEYAKTIFETRKKPDEFREPVRSNLLSAFYFYIGTTLAARGEQNLCGEWLNAGALREEEGLFSSTYLMGFLHRHQGKMSSPTLAFEDPKPYIHFSQVPVMKNVRHQMCVQFGHSLPEFREPVRFMDIGCGDGGLTVQLLTHLQKTEKVRDYAEIRLIDQSPAMVSLAEKNVRAAFPGIPISTDNARMQDCSRSIHQRYDIAMSSLAYHHMPIEDKRVHLTALKSMIDHFLLFEMDGNHDTPELYSPELALSVYQTYGRIMDFVFAHDAPAKVVIDCIDSFLMTELISIMSQPRGIRTDYHMLRTEWYRLFEDVFTPDFSLRSDSICYADEYLALFSMHYGRTT